MTQQRLSIFLAAVLLSVVSFAGCDRSSSQSDKQSAEQERRAQEGRQREEQQTLEKANAEIKKQEAQRAAAANQKVVKFVESAQPALKQFKAMKMRSDNGLSLVEYRQKLGEITDAIAGIGTPPDNRAKPVVEGLQRALDAYNRAQEPWAREMQNKHYLEKWGTPDTIDVSDPMHKITQTTLNNYNKQRSERLRLWAEAQANVDQAAAILETLQQ